MNGKLLHVSAGGLEMYESFSQHRGPNQKWRRFQSGQKGAWCRNDETRNQNGEGILE